MKLKNINRGIVLGAVLTIGVAGHVIGQNIRFKASIPEIKDRVSQMCDELVQGSVGSGDGVKRKLTAAVQNDFFDYEMSEEQWGSTRADLLQGINSYQDFGGTVYESKLEIVEIKVQKSGPNGANVKLEYALDTVFEGEAVVIAPSGSEYINDDTESSKEGKQKSHLEGQTEMYLQNTDGVWKIGYTQGYSYYNQVEPYYEEGGAV